MKTLLADGSVLATKTGVGGELDDVLRRTAGVLSSQYGSAALVCGYGLDRQRVEEVLGRGRERSCEARGVGSCEVAVLSRREHISPRGFSAYTES